MNESSTTNFGVYACVLGYSVWSCLGTIFCTYVHPPPFSHIHTYVHPPIFWHGKYRWEPHSFPRSACKGHAIVRNLFHANTERSWQISWYTNPHTKFPCITTSEKGLSSPILHNSPLCCLQFWKMVKVTLPHLREIFPQNLEKLNLRKLYFFHCTSCKWWLTTRMEWYGLQAYTALHVYAMLCIPDRQAHPHTHKQRCTLAPPPLHVASLATPCSAQLVWPDYTSTQSPVHNVKGIHDYSRL